MNNKVDNDRLDESELSNDLDFYYLIGTFYRYKKLIISVTTLVGILAIIYVLVATKYYMSVTSMYPVTKDNGGPLKELATTLGMASKSDGYYMNEVLNSRKISKRIIYHKYKTESFEEPVDLIKFWGLEEIKLSDNRVLDIALNKLNGAVKIKEDKETGLITISVTTKDKLLSSNMGHYYTKTVTDYLNKEQKTAITQTIYFTKKRLKDVKENLSFAENDLIEFQKANNRLSSPKLSMESKRMFSQIKLYEDVVVLLEKQYELLKIEEVRERPIINILDDAEILEKPVRPERRKTVIVSTFLAFVLSYLSVLLKEKAQRYKVIEKIIAESTKK